MSRRTIASILAALVLSGMIAGPAAAGGPTYSGYLWCVSTVTGEFTELNELQSATKKHIAEAKRSWTSGAGFCEKGSVDTSFLVQDP